MGLKKATIIDGKEFSNRTIQSLLPNVKLIVDKILEYYNIIYYEY